MGSMAQLSRLSSYKNPMTPVPLPI